MDKDEKIIMIARIELLERVIENMLDDTGYWLMPGRSYQRKKQDRQEVLKHYFDEARKELKKENGGEI